MSNKVNVNKENEAHKRGKSETPKKRECGFDSPQTPVGLHNPAKEVHRSILVELQNASSPLPPIVVWEKCSGVNKRKRSFSSFSQVTERVAMNASKKAVNKKLATEFRHHSYGKPINA